MKSLAVLACSILGGCAPHGAEPRVLPAVSGAYPSAAAGADAGVRGARDTSAAAWAAADAFRITAHLSLTGVLARLSSGSAYVPMRVASWPAAVVVTHVGDAGLTLTGAQVPASALADDFRCGGGGDAAFLVQMVVEVVEEGAGVVLEVKLEGPDRGDCELSSRGRIRLQRAGMDALLWLRRLGHAGFLPPRVTG